MSSIGEQCLQMRIYCFEASLNDTLLMFSLVIAIVSMEWCVCNTSAQNILVWLPLRGRLVYETSVALILTFRLSELSVHTIYLLALAMTSDMMLFPLLECSKVSRLTVILIHLARASLSCVSFFVT